MKIFITGATGFIGTELVRELLEKNHVVIGMYRQKSKIRIPDHPNLNWVKCSFFDTGQLLECMAGCDVVFHLAAYARVWSKDPGTYYHINVEGTRNILDAAKKTGVKKFIFTSTAGVLGPSNGHDVDENHRRTDPYFTEYERTKELAESMVLESGIKGMHTVVLLPTRLYGPGLLNESNSVTRLIRKYIKGTWRFLPGNGKKTGNYVFIKDVVRGHMLAMGFDGSHERFILGGTNINYRDFFNTVGMVSGKKRWLLPIPSEFIILLSYFMRWGAELLGYEPLITPGWARKYLHNWSVTSQKAIDDLGYTITTLDKGIQITYEWLKNQEHE